MEPSAKRQLRSFFLGGLVPVVAFALIEDRFGTLWGLVAGMAFGVGEILYEWFRLKRVDPFTWFGNGMLLVLGSVSLITQEGVWFKLQPAILEAAFGFLLFYSVLSPGRLGGPFLLAMSKKQGQFDRMRPDLKPFMAKALTGMTLRLSLFFLFHALLATWAALKASTAVWAFLKGIGFTVSMVVYLVAETGVLRYRIAHKTTYE